jgi:hypothetical protein
LFATIVEIERLEFKRVKYYSIAFEDHNSEFLDFQQRMRQSHKTQLGELVTLLYEIGELYGAKTNFFRDERKADALPPESFQYLGQDDQDPENPYGLRLYCLRITESIVILLNGDLKTAEKVDDCENCKRHFQLANKVATKIEEAIREKWITHNGKQLIDIDSFEFEI